MTLAMPVTLKPGDSLLLPLGHYTGAFYPAVDAPLKYHNFRIGMRTAQLPDENRFDVWALLHGPSEDDKRAGTVWDRTAAAAAATELKVANFGPIIEELLEVGVAAEVTVGTPGAVEFARTHRLQSLMTGLGHDLKAPGEYGIGLLPVTVAVMVPYFTYAVWQWGHVAPTLWDLCAGLAEVARTDEDEVRSPDWPTDPEEVLPRLLGCLHSLLAHNAIYLDTAIGNADAA